MVRVIGVLETVIFLLFIIEVDWYIVFFYCFDEAIVLDYFFYLRKSKLEDEEDIRKYVVGVVGVVF